MCLERNLKRIKRGEKNKSSSAYYHQQHRHDHLTSNNRSKKSINASDDSISYAKSSSNKYKMKQGLTFGLPQIMYQGKDFV